MRGRTLVVVGDRIGGPDDASQMPRRDYHVLAAQLGGDIVHAGMLGHIRGRGRGGIALARLAASHAAGYDNIYCDSEHIGLPLALLLRRAKARPRLTMIAHYLTPIKKRTLIRLLGLVRKIDGVVVHSKPQLERARSLGFADEDIALIPYQVDTAFWRPTIAPPSHIAAAGHEFRDYLTLMRAVDSLPIRVRIADGSPWSARPSTYREDDIPPNVTVQRLPYGELRDMYAAARFVVVPLRDVDFQAGIITILEAMAMGKCVVVTRTAGQTGMVTGPLMDRRGLTDIGEHNWSEPTGIYVPPGDAASLRAALEYLLEHPDMARQMGAAGRRFAERELSIERFAERMATFIALDHDQRRLRSEAEP